MTAPLYAWWANLSMATIAPPLGRTMFWKRVKQLPFCFWKSCIWCIENGFQIHLICPCVILAKSSPWHSQQISAVCICSELEKVKKKKHFSVHLSKGNTIGSPRVISRTLMFWLLDCRFCNLKDSAPDVIYNDPGRFQMISQTCAALEPASSGRTSGGKSLAMW